MKMNKCAAITDAIMIMIPFYKLPSLQKQNALNLSTDHPKKKSNDISSKSKNAFVFEEAEVARQATLGFIPSISPITAVCSENICWIHHFDGHCFICLVVDSITRTTEQ